MKYTGLLDLGFVNKEGCSWAAYIVKGKIENGSEQKRSSAFSLGHFGLRAFGRSPSCQKYIAGFLFW